MSRVRPWDAVATWALPSLVLAVGIFPPHVHASLSGALAAAGLLLAVALAGSGRIPAARAGVTAPLLAAALLACLSAAAALNPIRSFRMLVVWLVGGLVFSAARGLGAESEARRTARSLVLLATLLAAVGLHQTFVGFPAAAAEFAGPTGAAQISDGAGQGSPSDGENDGALPGAGEAFLARLRSGRAVGTLGLPALLASILILAIPLSVAEAAQAAWPGRALWIGSLALQGAALAATRSVGGLAGLAVAVLACGVAWTDLRPAARRTLVAVVLVVAAAAVAPRLLGEGDGSASRSLWLRVANWRAAVSMIVSHPVLGVGPDNYAVAFPQHRTWESNETQHAHNSYLEAVADLGLPALLLLAVGIAGLARAVWSGSGRRDGGTTRVLWRRALAVSCAAWAFQALFDFTAYLAATLVPFLAVAGLLAREEIRRSNLLPAAGPAGPPAGIPARGLILAAAAVAALASIPDATARRHLDAAVEAASRSDFLAAAGEARRSVRWNPLDAEAHLVLSRALLDLASGLPPSDPTRAGAIAEALDEAEESVRLDPHTANRRVALAMARASAGDGAGAYAAVAAAVRLNPFRPSYAAERDSLREILMGRSGGGVHDGDSR